MVMTKSGWILVLACMLIKESLATIALGADCTAEDSACTDTNAVCTVGNMCVCAGTFYDDNGDTTAGGACVAKVAVDGDCSATILCADANTKLCDATVTTCVCKDGWTKNATTSACVVDARVALDEDCSATILCADANTKPCDATVTTCVCKDGWAKNATTSECVDARIALEGTCTATDVCADTNAECSADKCTCKGGYEKKESACKMTNGGDRMSLSGVMLAMIAILPLLAAWNSSW